MLRAQLILKKDFAFVIYENYHGPFINNFTSTWICKEIIAQAKIDK